jgi:hypothetical protein
LFSVGAVEITTMHARLLVGVFCLFLVGCGKKELKQETVYPTKGTIIYNGEPARFVVVRFVSVGKGGAEATAVTNEQGEFELRTYSNEDPDGAPPGEYKVVIEGYDPLKSGGAPKGAKPPTKVDKTVESKETYTVKEDENELGEIKVP